MSGSLLLVHLPNVKPGQFYFTLSQHTAMSVQITVAANEIRAVYEDTVASVPGNNLCFAHFGCKLLGTLLDDFKKNSWPFPGDLAAAWDKARPGWRDKKEAVGRLADSLRTATDVCGFHGLVLVDTMRKGSDYWRPGNLLTQAADQIRQKASQDWSVTYCRDDRWCPSSVLLAEFRENATMPFGEYAARYARDLSQESVEAAAWTVIMRPSPAQDGRVLLHRSVPARLRGLDPDGVPALRATLLARPAPGNGTSTGVRLPPRYPGGRNRQDSS